jgi:muramoyltetrapeptide carboxypeptidase LdcA involved in peptidoglycan recycling
MDLITVAKSTPGFIIPTPVVWTVIATFLFWGARQLILLFKEYRSLRVKDEHSDLLRTEEHEAMAIKCRSEVSKEITGAIKRVSTDLYGRLQSGEVQFSQLNKSMDEVKERLGVIETDLRAIHTQNDTNRVMQVLMMEKANISPEEISRKLVAMLGKDRADAVLGILNGSFSQHVEEVA